MEFTVLTGARVLVSTDGYKTLAIDTGEGGALIHATPPVFDLIEMGLPPVSMDGNAVSIQCDASKLYEACIRGPVILRGSLAYEGVVIPFDVVCTAYVGPDPSNGQLLAQMTAPFFFGHIRFSVFLCSREHIQCWIEN